MFDSLREHMADTAQQMLKNSLEATGEIVEAGETVLSGMVQRNAEPIDDEND